MKERKNRNITIYEFMFAFSIVNIFGVFNIIINILEHRLREIFLGVEIVYLTFASHIFFGPIKVWSMLHHGAVRMSSE